MGPAEPHEVQQIQVQLLHLGCVNSHYQFMLWDVRMGYSPTETDLRVQVEASWI